MTSENKEFDDFYAGRMSREEEEKFIDKYGNKVNSFEINNNFDEIYATNDPKLTHREIAKKLCAKLMLRFELKNGTIGTQVSIIEKAFMQLANEALDDYNYNFGNYFRTREQAQEYADECKKVAERLHEKFGE